MEQSLLERIINLERLDPTLLFDSSSSREQKIVELSNFIKSITNLSELTEVFRTHHSNSKFSVDEICDFLLVTCSFFGGEYNFKFNLGEDLERVLEFICSDRRFSICDFITLLDGAILETNNGLRITQFSIDNAIVIASHYYSIPQNQIVRTWANTSHSLVTKYGPGNIPFPETFQELVLKKYLKKVSKSDRIVYSDQLNTLFYLDPPWKVFDYPPRSMGWRMGGGEDYMGKWRHYFEKLDDNKRTRYLELGDVSPEWREWLAKAFESNI